MKVKKAVITAAGYGTRFLPITKAVQKEMLPILNRPTIDYVVEDCLKAGIEEIVFVIREGDIQIQQYYSENEVLMRHLEKFGKTAEIAALHEMQSKAKWTFVEQKAEMGYGTAIPLRVAREFVEQEEAFVMYMGDDLIYHSDGSSEVAALISTLESSGADAVMDCVERPEELLHKYGIVEMESRDGHHYLKTLVEKPARGTAPSNLANVVKFILTPKIFKHIDAVEENEQKEYFLNDALLALAKDGSVAVHASKGQHLDCGYMAGWIKANLIMAAADPKLLEELGN